MLAFRIPSGLRTGTRLAPCKSMAEFGNIILGQSRHVAGCVASFCLALVCHVICGLGFARAWEDGMVTRSLFQALPRQRNKHRSCCANEIAGCTYIGILLWNRRVVMLSFGEY